MSDVRANPNDLRDFAKHLKKSSEDLQRLRNTTKAKMQQLNQSWRDQENARFVEQFEQEMKSLEKLTKTAEDYSKFLTRKAEALEAYLRR